MGKGEKETLKQKCKGEKTKWKRSLKYISIIIYEDIPCKLKNYRPKDFILRTRITRGRGR